MAYSEKVALHYILPSHILPPFLLIRLKEKKRTSQNFNDSQLLQNPIFQLPPHLSLIFVLFFAGPKKSQENVTKKKYLTFFLYRNSL
jgi:hypothetical protein